MALLEPPTTPPPHVVEVRLVADFDEYVAAYRVVFDVFDVPEETRTACVRHCRSSGDTPTARTPSFTHLVLVDGKPVGFSFTFVGTIGLLLNGSGVLPEARGRGVYRALSPPCWAEAVEREKPALVVQAGSMSGPFDPRAVRVPAHLQARPVRRSNASTRHRISPPESPARTSDKPERLRFTRETIRMLAHASGSLLSPAGPVRDRAMRTTRPNASGKASPRSSRAAISAA